MQWRCVSDRHVPERSSLDHAYLVSSVVDPDPAESETFCRIRILNRKKSFRIWIRIRIQEAIELRICHGTGSGTITLQGKYYAMDGHPKVFVRGILFEIVLWKTDNGLTSWHNRKYGNDFFLSGWWLFSDARKPGHCLPAGDQGKNGLRSELE